MGPTGLIPLGGVLQSGAAWVETTWLHYFATNYKWVWATMETLHFLGMGLLIGTVGVLDLRLIGVAKGLPIESTQKLVPWGIGGFILNTLTGIVFLAGAPYQYLYNFAFQMKVLFMLAAGINVTLFYRAGTWPRAKKVGVGDEQCDARRRVDPEARPHPREQFLPRRERHAARHTENPQVDRDVDPDQEREANRM